MKEYRLFYRRRLPHFQTMDAILFVTFRLAHSLPKEIVVQLIREREDREAAIRTERDIKVRSFMLSVERRRYFGYFDSYLDNLASDICWLSVPEVASLLSEAIRFYDGKAFDVIAYCIMPNHVHLVVDMQRSNAPIYGILRRIKTFSAVKGNALLKRAGAFWNRENYDHVVRDGEELKRIVRYVMENPVKAGLCNTWRDWKWTYVDESYL